MKKIHQLKNPQDAVSDVIEKVGLTPEKGKKIGQLSKGYQQRVGIARALAQKPKFILADEPIASLDPASSHQVLSNLQKICQEDQVLYELMLR